MIVTTPNKLGLDCEYTTELAGDLLAVHGLDVVKVFAELHATSFHIRKDTEKRFGRIFLEFTLKTGDERDVPFSWKINAGIA